MRQVLLVALLLLHDFHSYAQTDAVEDTVIDTVFKLREVRQMSDLIQKKHKGKHRLLLNIYCVPSKDAPYYCVKVWEDNGGTYVTIFDFFVYPKTLEIRYLDRVKDRVLSLEQWRKQRAKKTSNR